MCVFPQVYQRLDQPITALSLFKQGLDQFPGEVTLLTGIARIHEVQYVTVVIITIDTTLKMRNHIHWLYCVTGDEQHCVSHRVLQRCPEAG